MPDIHLHTTLLALPLFLGMSRNDIAEVVAHTRFGVVKVGRNKTVVGEGDVCDSIYILTSSKSEILRLSEQYEIFRLNLLNIISTQGQRISRLPWHPIPKTIHAKIIRFFQSHCLHPVGSKTLNIKMETLAREIGESRLNVSRELNRMHEEGLIQITRGIIRIPAMEKLQ